MRCAGSKRYRMPPASASNGNVRIPPGRLTGTSAKKSSKARPRKKLNPRRKPKLMAEGLLFIGSQYILKLKRSRHILPGNPPNAEAEQLTSVTSCKSG